MKTVELDDAETRLLARALRTQNALLEDAIRGFKRAYGDYHGFYTAPLQNQVDDIALILAKLGEVS